MNTGPELGAMDTGIAGSDDTGKPGLRAADEGVGMGKWGS